MSIVLDRDKAQEDRELDKFRSGSIVEVTLLTCFQSCVLFFRSRPIICSSTLQPPHASAVNYVPQPDPLPLMPVTPHPAAPCLCPAGGSPAHVPANHPEPRPHRGHLPRTVADLAQTPEHGWRGQVRRRSPPHPPTEQLDPTDFNSNFRICSPAAFWHDEI